MKEVEVSKTREIPDRRETISHLLALLLLANFSPEDLKFPASATLNVLTNFVKQAYAHLETVQPDEVKSERAEIKYDFPQFKRELTPDDIGKYVVIYIDTGIQDLPTISKPRIILQVRRIGSVTLINETVQILEGGIVNYNIDGTYTVGESKMYHANNIAYFLPKRDETTVSQGLR